MSLMSKIISREGAKLAKLFNQFTNSPKQDALVTIFPLLRDKLQIVFLRRVQEVNSFHHHRKPQSHKLRNLCFPPRDKHSDKYVRHREKGIEIRDLHTAMSFCKYQLSR